MSVQVLPPRPDSLAETGNLRRRQSISQVGRFMLMTATLFAVLALAVLLWYIVQRGWGWRAGVSSPIRHLENQPTRDEHRHRPARSGSFR